MVPIFVLLSFENSGAGTFLDRQEGTENQWWTPAAACRFRTAHLRTIWSPVPHHTLSYRSYFRTPHTFVPYSFRHKLF